MTAARRIVIVEDEGILAMDIAQQLSSAGFDVRGIAMDGDEAVRLCAEQRPELVLMDIRIQGPRDGIDVAAQLRAQLDVPVVFLTSHSDPDTMTRARSTEPMGYLLKPFKQHDLRNIVTIGLARSDAEKDLKRREGTLRTTLSCIGEALLTTDGKNAVTWLNPAAEELLSAPLERAKHRPLAAVLPLSTPQGAPLATDELLSRARQQGRVRVEAKLPVATGQRDVAGVAAALPGEDSGVVLALQDLTELLATRQQLEFAARLASLGTLTAGIAHEVNNPLAITMANLNYALQSTSPPLAPDLREALAEARDACIRMHAIVADLGDFARPQPEALEALRLPSVVRYALSLTRTVLRTKAGVRLELGDGPPLLGTPIRLGQVVTNLITNAAQAATSAAEPLVTVRTGATPDGWAFIEVSDNGPGVPDHLKERIFEPFFTTKDVGDGTGLGLSVVRSIVLSHKGRLEVAQEPGGGARFRCAFPPTVTERPAPPNMRRVPPEGPVDSEAVETVDVVLVEGTAARSRAVAESLRKAIVLRLSDERPGRGETTLSLGSDQDAIAAFARG